MLEDIVAHAICRATGGSCLDRTEINRMERELALYMWVRDRVAARIDELCDDAVAYVELRAGRWAE